MNPDAMWIWAKLHPASAIVYAAAFVLWLVANVAPRPHPEEHAGWKKVFWTVVDRLSALSSNTFPGSLKLPLMPSPLPVLLAAMKEDETQAKAEPAAPAAETERKEP